MMSQLTNQISRTDFVEAHFSQRRTTKGKRRWEKNLVLCIFLFFRDNSAEEKVTSHDKQIKNQMTCGLNVVECNRKLLI